jgi:hypothetical protein
MSATPNEFHFGVVVGIDLYPGMPNRDLKSARDDANEFANWLRDPDGGHVPKGNVETIVEAGPFHGADNAEPTREAVNKAFQRIHTRAREVFGQNPTRWNESRLYVYFSGHGLAPDPSEVAVLMANATDQEPYNIPCFLYLTYYEKNQDFHEIVIFSDCCRSLKKETPVAGPPFMPNPKTYGFVVSALGYATQYNRPAYEPEDTSSRGFYTRALLDGLRGDAEDPTCPGEINSTSLQLYLSARVTAMTKGKKYPQVPTMRADPAAKIVFRQGAKRTLHQVTIVFPQNFHGTVKLIDGSRRTLDTHSVTGQPWQRSLTDGLYKVQVKLGDAPFGFKNDGMFEVLGSDTNVQL